MTRSSVAQKLSRLLARVMKREARELSRSQEPKSNRALMRKIERSLLRAKK